MKNTSNLVWTTEALQGLAGIIHYLESNFSEKEVVKFSKGIDKSLGLISKTPDLFPFIHVKKRVRRCVVAKLTSIYYTVKEENIVIISVVDSRKQPRF